MHSSLRLTLATSIIYRYLIFQSRRVQSRVQRINEPEIPLNYAKPRIYFVTLVSKVQICHVHCPREAALISMILFLSIQCTDTDMYSIICVNSIECAFKFFGHVYGDCYWTRIGPVKVWHERGTAQACLSRAKFCFLYYCMWKACLQSCTERLFTPIARQKLNRALCSTVHCSHKFTVMAACFPMEIAAADGNTADVPLKAGSIGKPSVVQYSM